MTAIDRTAYPRPGARLTPEELYARYSLSEADHDFVSVTARADAGRLTLAMMLKTRLDFGYFPALTDIHGDIMSHLETQLAARVELTALTRARASAKTLYRYREAIRSYIRATSYDDTAERLVTDTVLAAAKTMSDPADLINRAVEALKEARIDLPAFSTLDRSVNHLRAQVHERIYDQVAQHLTIVDMAALDNLLVVPPDTITTPFNRLKQAPRPATFAAIKLWANRLQWLDSLISPDAILKDIAHTKQRQFASEAAMLEVSDLLDIAQPGKRHTLLLCLIRQTRARCRDELIEMLFRRVRRTKAVAKDYRTQLLPWSECLKRLKDYCENLTIPQSGEAFAAMMKEQLTQLAAEVDAGFPGNSQLSIDAKGTPHLKKLPAAKQLAGQTAFVEEIRRRMPERHLLDILKYTEHWSRYTRHFGPPSGADTKLSQAVRRYLFTVFGYGCNLGPGQAAKHATDIASAQVLRRINAQHIDAGKLEAAMSDVIGEYARFALPKVWGTGNAAIADGTHVPLCENNLLGSTHIRYGGYGGIAYHHIANNYIALFTSFISCGVWEAVHILDGLLKNHSDIQPETLHADTQGQSEPVFGLARLLGIILMPRIRNWHDVAFCRPDKSIRYRHIDALFTADIDWQLIITHWQDMMQVVLSIQAGLVLPSMLLRKLGSYNRKNRLCLAFSELGRVERTLFLLRYISDSNTRHTIRAETTKIESYNDFLDWITFGGPIIKSGDPIEQEKQLKYASLIANTIMLSNVTDLTEVMANMAEDGHPVTPELAASISPYSREHIRRFGKLTLDMDEVPPPLNPKPLPFEIAL